jgi:hypothetical protein
MGEFLLSAMGIHHQRMGFKLAKNGSHGKTTYPLVI